MIEVEALVKKYGDFAAVNDISFQVDKGEVLGFLGPNGAGKSTTMKIITCFLPPTAGTVRVGGHDIATASLAVREQIGYLPETSPTYPEMTVREFLGFMAEMRGLRHGELHRAVDHALEMTTLGDVADQIIETLSKGYRQRTCLAQALIHDPPVLILDEPTDGLDPNQKHHMRELILRMKEHKTILLSTHILEEMEAVCSRAIIISQGRIQADGTPAQLAAKSRWHQAVTLRPHKDDGGALKDKLARIKGVAEVAWNGGPVASYTLFPKTGQTVLPEVTRFLEENQVGVDQVFVERGKVDEVFRQVTGQ